MGAAFTAAWAVAKGIPIWIYIAIAGCSSWLYERHEATAWHNKYTLLQAQDATSVIDDLREKNDESARRNTELQGGIDAANQRSAVAAANAASSAAASVRLSRELAAAKKQLGSANHSTAPDELAAARAAVDVLTDLLGERSSADRERSRFADAAYSAALGCKQQYDSLTPSKTGGTGIKAP